MDSQELVSSGQAILAKPKKGRPKRRFVFTIDRDNILLECALNLNPWQLGTDKWGEISKDLTRKFGSVMKERTIRERLSNLISKFEKEQLESKTGTEEQQTKRGDLLKEIIAIKAAEKSPINEELGADFEIEGLEDDLLSPIKSKPKKGNSDRIEADAERDTLLKTNYADVPPQNRATKMKRTKAAMEEDLIMEKARHDISMEQKRFKLEEVVKHAELSHEDKRLEIELMRERRLAEENAQRNVIFDLMKKVIEKQI